MNDDLEFSISQYLDGTLPQSQRVALEERLASDPEAQAILAEDRALTDALRSMPLPDVQWGRFAESISAHIDRDLEERMDRVSWRLSWRLPTGLAIAASVLLAVGIGVHLWTQPTNSGSGGGGHTGPSEVTQVLYVEGPQIDRPQGPVVSEISVAAGGSYASDPSLSPYDDEMDNRPSRVVIASGVSADRPVNGFPY